MASDIESEMFCSTKWVLLKELAEKPQSPSELAEKTQTSLSNIVQQLKLLEAYGIVKKEKAEPTNSNGKPKMIYSISKPLIQVVFLKDGKAEKGIFKTNIIIDSFMNLLFASTEDIYFIAKFLFQNEEVLKKCKSIALFKSTKDSIELFLITDHIGDIRTKFSNTFIQDLFGKTKKIVNWTHNEHEIKEGLHRKDKYFVDMIKNSKSIQDNSGILRQIKQSHGY